MKEELKRFCEAIASDKELENEMITMAEGLPPEEKLAKAIEFANTKGFQISKEDFVADGQKVDLEEMEKYAGGKTCVCVVGGGGTEMDCVCVGPGLGTKDNYVTCGCMAFGGGGY